MYLGWQAVHLCDKAYTTKVIRVEKNPKSCYVCMLVHVNILIKIKAFEAFLNQKKSIIQKHTCSFNITEDLRMEHIC